MPLDQIDLKKLTGLTNETFKVSHKTEDLPWYVLRIFGKAEGMVCHKKENYIFKELGE